MIEIFKEEPFARERTEAIDNTENSFQGENLFTAQTLANHSYENTRLNKSDREKQVCIYCQSKDHISTRCVNVKNVKTRKNILRSSGRCFLCLNKGHRIQHCKVKYACAKCSSKRHNVSICEKVKQDKGIKNEDNNEAPPIENVVMQVNSNSQAILLQTAKAEMFNCDEYREATSRILFDPCSQRTYCRGNLRKTLKLKSMRKETILMKRFALDERVLKVLDVVQICVRGKTKAVNVYIEALCIPLLCSPLQDQTLNGVFNKNYDYLKNLSLSDDYSNTTDKLVDLLIGLDYYFNFVTGKIRPGPPSCPLAVDSIETKTIEQNLKEELSKFWETENVGIGETKYVYNNLESTIRFDGSRYVTSLPFKPHHQFLPDNYSIAKYRLYNLKKRLDNNLDLKIEYDNIFRNYLNEGIIEKVNYESAIPGCVHYLPHHAVICNDKETTKVRVVFDASAKLPKSPSLNECLYAGPCLLSLVYDVLLRFHLQRIVLISDIKQAFLNVGIREEDCDYIRFLWFKDIFSENPEITIYRFLRVVFGLICSPFLLNATVKHHASKYSTKWKYFVEKILRDLYVVTRLPDLIQFLQLMIFI